MKLFIDKLTLLQNPDVLLKLKNKLKFDRAERVEDADEILFITDTDTSSPWAILVGQYVAKNYKISLVGDHNIDLSYLEDSKIREFKTLDDFIAAKSVSLDINTNVELETVKDILNYLSAALFTYLPEEHVSAEGPAFIIKGDMVSKFKNNYKIQFNFSENGNDLYVEMKHKGVNKNVRKV